MSHSEVIIATASSLIIACSVVAIQKKRQRRQRRCWVRQWLANGNLSKGNLNLLNEFQEPKIYLNYVRMDETTFEKLLQLIRLDIEKKNTVMREAISAKHRLIITLRFLATGSSYRSLMYDFRISESVISQIVPDVCRAIYKSLKHNYLRVPNRVVDWLNVAGEFRDIWNFPQCLGAMDGKHIEFRAPRNAGSTYYNYKGSNSIVLLALVDAHYNFLYIDVGTNGRVSDGGVFRSSQLYHTLETNILSFPEEATLPGGTKDVPYVIVADAAFPLLPNLLKPYPFRNLSEEMRIFNYRLSRARRVVENECKKNYRGSEDYDKNATFKYGLSQQGGNRTRNDAQDIRKEFSKYFNGVGSVSWQYDN